MQILNLLGMYFDAQVVEVKTFLLLFRLALAIVSIICYRFIQMTYYKISIATISSMVLKSDEAAYIMEDRQFCKIF